MNKARHKQIHTLWLASKGTPEMMPIAFALKDQTTVYIIDREKDYILCCDDDGERSLLHYSEVGFTNMRGSPKNPRAMD